MRSGVGWGLNRRIVTKESPDLPGNSRGTGAG